MEQVQKIIHDKRSLLAHAVYHVRLARQYTLNALEDYTVKRQLEFILFFQFAPTLHVIDDIIMLAKDRRHALFNWPGLEQIRHSHPMRIHQHAVVNIDAFFHELESRDKRLVKVAIGLRLYFFKFTIFMTFLDHMPF